MYLIGSGIVVLAIAFYIWWNRPGRCYSKARLDGKIVVVTGANTGIGKETVKNFINRGATVVMGCRSLSRGNQAADDIKSATGNSDRVVVRQLDLGSLKSIHAFAKGFLEEFSKLHILVNNAGIMFCAYTLTEDGFEQQFGVNHLGHFALTNLLLPRMKESGPGGRIVNLTSVGHILFTYFNMDDLLWEKKAYDQVKAYGQSKLCNVLFTKELHRRLADDGITAYAVHPGNVATDLMRHSSLLTFFYPIMARIYYKTPEEGAQTSVHCAVQEGLESLSGEYFADCARLKSAKMSYDVDKAKELWEVSEKLSGVKYPF